MSDCVVKSTWSEAAAAGRARTDEALWALTLGALRRLGLPAELAARQPDLLDRQLALCGVRKLGERLRVRNLLHRHGAAGGAPMAGAGRRVEGVSSLPGAIPRRMFIYWDDESPPELVKCCIALMKHRHPGWQLRVIGPGCPDLPPPPVPLDSLMGSHQADWYRLAALAEYGGVYLDATCVTLQPVTQWIEMDCGDIQGFFFVPDGETMESWAIAAPCNSSFIREWLEEFRRALHQGLKAYCRALPDTVISHELRPSLMDGYLAIHAAWRACRNRLPETCFRLHSPVELGRPYRYLAEQQWQSGLAVNSLLRKSAEELANTPLIKLRGAERKEIQRLASYGSSSWLVRTLLGVTTPLTVSERLTFIACGLEIPD